MTLRNLETEHHDTPDRKYAYNFDLMMHDYMLRTFAPSGGRALEMGCYKGAFTAKLVPLFDSVCVVEGVGDLIDAARKVAPAAEYVLSRFEDYEPYEQFDAIFLIHTLEHLDDPHDVLLRIKPWLKPDGKLFVAVPNAYAVSRRLAVKMGLVGTETSVTPPEYAHGHRRTYDLNTLIRELQDATFFVQESGGIFFKPLSNRQLDLAVAYGVVDQAYLDACYELGKSAPGMCASIYAVASA